MKGITTHGVSAFSRFYLLLGMDSLLAIFSGVTGRLLRFGQSYFEFNADHKFAIIVVAVIVVSSSYLFDVYNLGRHRGKRLVANSVLQAATCSFLLLTIIYYLIPSLEMGRGLLAITLVVFVGCQFFWHIAFAALFSKFLPTDNVLVLGTGDMAEKIGSLVQSANFQFGHVFAGYVALPNNNKHKVPVHLILCAQTELSKHVSTHAVTHIVVAGPERRGKTPTPMLSELLRCKFLGVTIQDSPTYYELKTGKLLLEDMDMDWLIFSDGFKCSALFSVLKRQADIVLSLSGLILALPLFPLIAILIKLNAPGPIFYSQTRVGQREKPFSIYKFRTMTEGSEGACGAVWAQENDPRIKPIGGLIRKFRIDELPQLYNILKGEMSFVGPRPERPEFVAQLKEVIPLYGKRHFIKPGLTGWAQVRYPYGSSVEDSYEKLRYDLYYFKNMTPIFDTIIFAKTLKVVLCGAGGR